METSTRRASHHPPPFLLLILLLLHPAAVAPRGLVGVTYRVDIPGIPNSSVVAPALAGAGVPRIRLVNAKPADIASFVGKDIEINLAVQDLRLFTKLGSKYSFALQWLNETVVPTYPQAGITSITVGERIFTDYPNMSRLVLPAVKNVYRACGALRLHINVSTGHSFDIITKPFPPSAAEIQQSIQPYMAPLLKFLLKTHGDFQISLFPFDLYRERAIPGMTTSFVMFEAWEDDYLDDPFTYLTYPNLFSVMVDAAVLAIYQMNTSGIPITVIGTGWPSDGNKVTEPEASRLYSAEYNERLVSLINMQVGTPMRRHTTPITYIYTLFDEQKRKGVESYENHWGIWEPDLSVKYMIDFSVSAADCERRPLEPLLQLCALWALGFLLLFLVEENRLF